MTFLKQILSKKLFYAILIAENLKRVHLYFIDDTKSGVWFSQIQKIIAAVLSGMQDKNIAFFDLKNLLLALGFNLRIKGDHHIFTRNDVDEIINIQPVGSKAKPYQVKQIRNIILKYKFGGLE